ncbi:MAG: competence/damage-inducible protein A, partial [Deltaproteobacteria bacterium]|nr:competence/damage-inducible protein A [Deltaproteobacteria bacterium]
MMNTGLEAGRPESLRCEIITIGSELLLGQIVDTNTVYLAKELGRIGLAVGFRTAVGDRLEDIELAIRQALARSDLVITTGGLGPTEDDLTRQAVAQAAGVELVYNQDLMNDIEVFFQR